MTNPTLQRFLPFFFLFSLVLQASSAMANTGTGLEMTKPDQLYVVYTVEPDSVDESELEAIIDSQLYAANIQQNPRDDAQLFLRIEEHAGEFLLYLDFSRTMSYRVNGKCYNKEGFVWGRYAKDIADMDELYESIEFLINEFIEEYTKANKL